LGFLGEETRDPRDYRRTPQSGRGSERSWQRYESRAPTGCRTTPAGATRRLPRQRVAADWKNNNQESLLGIASAYGHVQVASRLLGRGASINAQDDEGFTPLMNACQNRHVEVVRILLQKKADKSLTNRYGETALSLVRGKYEDTQAGKTRKEIVALLEEVK
jgi:hypothetical protein